MDTVNSESSDLALSSSSSSSPRSSESPTLALSSTTTTKPAAKSRPAPMSNQDGAAPRKQPRSDMTPQAPSPNTASAIPRISPERDDFTDGDHKRLDESIMDGLSAFREFNQEPKLSILLSLLTNMDKRLVILGVGEAKELLKREPSMVEMLRNAWQAGSFKEVRQLEILWPVLL